MFVFVVVGGVAHAPMIPCSACHVNLTAKEFISSYPLAIDAPVWYNTRMNTTTTRYSAVRSAAIDSFITLLAQATLFDLRAAERWYDEAARSLNPSARPPDGASKRRLASCRPSLPV